MRLILLLSLFICCCLPMPFDVVDKLPAAVYSDDFARYKVLPLVSATITDDPTICLNQQFQNAVLKRRLHLSCSKYLLDKCTGYTAVLHQEQAIAVVFRGAHGKFQDAMMEDETLFANQTAWVAGGSVNKYFNDGFFILWNGGMKDDFLALKNANPTYQLWVIGHSMGGALASLAASYITHTKLFPGNNMKLMTFGEPRVGDPDYAASIDKEVAYSFRVVHAKDPVPHFPSEAHYQQHHSEVFYNNDMSTPSYVICDNDEDMNCSDGQKDNTGEDHLWYFKNVVTWGEQGCPN